MVLHTPFRAWCPHCVKGRAKNETHWEKIKEENESMPIVAIHCMWMKSKKDNELNDEMIRGMPILVIKDLSTGYMTSHAIPAKGVNVHGHGIRAVITTLDYLGYKKLC